MRSGCKAVLLTAAALGASASLATAQGFPDRAVKVIVPTAPGGSIDTTARDDRRQDAGEMGQAGRGREPSRRGDAARRRGGAEIARRRLHAAGRARRHHGDQPAGVFRPALRSAEGLRAARPGDRDPRGADGQQVSVPAKSVAELVALAKQEPGQLTHASGGSATLLALELFKAMAGIDIRSIPYRGGAPAVTAAISGETSMIIADLTTGQRGLQSDRIRTLAVTSKTALAEISRRADARRGRRQGLRGQHLDRVLRAGRHAEGRRATDRNRDQGGGCDAGRARAPRDRRAPMCAAAAPRRLRQLLAADVAKWANARQGKEHQDRA